MSKLAIAFQVASQIFLVLLKELLADESFSRLA